MKKLYGVVVPIVTPLTQEDAIDVTSLKRLADHCIDSGMQPEEYRYLYTWVHGI